MAGGADATSYLEGRHEREAAPVALGPNSVLRLPLLDVGRPRPEGRTSVPLPSEAREREVSRAGDDPRRLDRAAHRGSDPRRNRRDDEARTRLARAGPGALGAGASAL